MALPFDTSRPGFWLSGLAHAALLTAGLVSFAAAKLPDADEGIPVEMVTDSELSQITRGETTARAVQPDPKPRVDRQAETRVEREAGEAPKDVPSPPKRPADVKVADEVVEPAPTPPKRPEVAKVEPPAKPDTAREEAAAAAAEAAKAEAAAKAAKAEAVQAEAAAKAAAAEKLAEERAAAAEKARIEKAEAEKAEAERKRIAEAKAKAEAERRRKLAEAKAKADKAKAEAEAKARQQAELADRFDPGDISQLLASKEPAQSSGATGRELQRTASLGTATGSAQKLSPSQRDQIAGLIREQLIKCWQPPVAVQTANRPPTAIVRVGLKQDGSLATEPSLANNSSDPLFRSIADSALRATRRCAPLRIPTRFVPFYDDWKDLVVDFDPRELG